MASTTFPKRTAALAVALLLAAFATLMLVSYTRDVESKAFAGAETVTVFVAKDDIPARTSAEDALAAGLIERVPIPRVAVAEDIIQNLNQIAGKYAAVPILKGEQILARRWATLEMGAGLLPIPEGRQAITIESDVSPAVGGFVRPGDHVSVIAETKVLGGKDDQSIARFLVQDVPVLAIDDDIVGRNNSANAADKKASGSTLRFTLAVKPADAEKLVLAVKTGSVYFTLLPAHAKPVVTNGRTSDTLFK